MQVAFHLVRAGTFTTWDARFSEAAEFASHIGRQELISISHSEDQGSPVVTVWYWQR